MTGTEVEIRKSHEIVGKLPSHILNKLILDNAEALSAPQILKPHREKTGSTDFAFVSHLIPSAVCRVAFVPRTPPHSKSFSGCREIERPMSHPASAKIIAGVVVDLIYSDETFKAVLQEHERIKAGGFDKGLMAAFHNIL